MRRVVVVVVLALVVWVVTQGVPGRAQDGTVPLGPFTITCTGGSILISSSVQGNSVTSELDLTTGVFANGSPYAAQLSGCLIWSTTPTP